MKQETLQALKQRFNQLEAVYRPEVRWWLAEGLNTDETLKKNIRQIHDLGFGAAEFLAMPEPGADSSVYGWGSQEWTSDTQLIIREATALGMGFSLTSGAHWATANLPDTFVWEGAPYGPDSRAASKELDYATVLLRGGETFSGPLPRCPKVRAVGGDAHGTNAVFERYDFMGAVAAKVLTPRPGAGQDHGYAEGTGTGRVCLESLTDLTAQVTPGADGPQLTWTAPQGDWALFVYWMHGTGQTAVPSVSTNYTINYMDPYGVQALTAYWDQVVLTDEMKRIVRQNGRGEIYMDSLELLTFGAGGLFWGYTLKDTFRRRKGYDVTRYLPILTGDKARFESVGPKQYDYTVPEEQLLQAEQVRRDYYDVISSCYCENVLRPLQQWLHPLGMKLRAEPSYGANFEISTPARYLDGVETESFAQTADADLYRGMLGGANVCGRPLSSETGAVHGRNYVYTMDDWTQLCYLQFALGVTRTVLHGYSGIEGSVPDTKWPGHEGMYPRFSERFGGRQPASTLYRPWTDALARCQKFLRQGQPQRDLAILRTDYFYVNYGKPRENASFENNFTMHDRAYFWQDLSLQRAGYTYDFFSPQLLDETTPFTGKALLPDGPAYKALILYQDALELDAAKRILAIAQGGLPVLFVHNVSETWTHNAPDRRYDRAAWQSASLSEPAEALRQVVAQIQALPNVRVLDGPEQVLGALEALGVTPGAAFASPNSRVLTCSRWDAAAQMRYTFAYCYKFQVEKGQGACAFTLCLEGTGTPYRVDEWSGAVTALTGYAHEDGRTCVPLSLLPGQTALIALDVSDPTPPPKAAPAADLPEPIALTRFDITVEDWDEGERRVNTEEKFGHVTQEVYYTTKKTPLFFPDSPLVPWRSLPATAQQLSALSGPSPSMAQVSGTAVYRAKVTVPESWRGLGAAVQVENANGGLVALTVNGQEAPAMHPRTLLSDVTGLLHPGENEIELRTASTLTNRMRARGYQNENSAWTDETPAVQDYGLTGRVLLTPLPRA